MSFFICLLYDYYKNNYKQCGGMLNKVHSCGSNSNSCLEKIPIVEVLELPKIEVECGKGEKNNSVAQISICSSVYNYSNSTMYNILYELHYEVGN